MLERNVNEQIQMRHTKYVGILALFSSAVSNILYEYSIKIPLSN